MPSGGVTTADNYLHPEKDWSFRAMAKFPRIAPPLPGLGHWECGYLWPNGDLLTVTYVP